MAKPQKDLRDEHFYKETDLFFQKFAELCKDPENAKLFLKELLTDSELRMIKKRWYIARLLEKGLDMRTIASKAEVSTTTVVRVAKRLKKRGSIFKKAVGSVEDTKLEYKSKEKEANSNLEVEEELEESMGEEPASRYVFGKD